MPPMVAISGSIICSQEVKGFDYSLKAGFEIGQVFGELDSRSNIDLPMVYHRLGVFNGWGVYSGVDIQKNVKILKYISILTSGSYRGFQQKTKTSSSECLEAKNL